MKRSAVVVLVLVALGPGCGGEDAEPADRPPSTTSTGERGAIERRLVRYFAQAEGLRWYGALRRFEVRGGTPVRGHEEIRNATVLVHTELPARGRKSAREICGNVLGADVADVGGTIRVLGEGGRRLAECRGHL